MKHTDKEIEEAAHRFETLADELGPGKASVEDLAHLRAIAKAAERARRDEACSPRGGAGPGALAKLEPDSSRPGCL
jgi:hypothetical protein